ncbi:hypothetical protein ACVWZL_000829 [Bradyrhizobium sp. GM2.4]
MWVSGSLIRSSTWRSSSVSAPCISSSICLPSSLERSRTMRGSFCQALPIGCMRVFMTPSCSSAVTLDSRCNGTLNSVSSLRRDISNSWLRVSTSSETMVIRCSSVSTLTRIDWLAMLAPSAAPSSAIAFFGTALSLGALASFAASLATGTGASAAGGGSALTSALATGTGTSIAVSRKARSSSSSETSPGRSGRSRLWSASTPEVGAASTATGASGTSGGASATAAAAPAGIGCAEPDAIGCADADIAAMPCSTIASSLSMRSRSVPSGSASVASSPARISLMRSIEDRITVTACPVTGMPSRNLPISVSPACASASSRGNPRKPHVPLMVWTSRKMLSRILALFGSCSNFTS